MARQKYGGQPGKENGARRRECDFSPEGGSKKRTNAKEKKEGTARSVIQASRD